MECFKFVDNMNTWIVRTMQRLLKLDKESDQGIRVGYSIEVILTEIEKLTCTLVAFACIGFIKEVFISLSVIMSIRFFMGGVHRKTTMGCILHTCLTEFIIIIFSKNISILKTEVGVLLFLLGIVEIWKTTPIKSEKGIIYTETQQLKFKLKAMTALLVLAITIQYVDKVTLNLIYWSIGMQLCEVIYVVVSARRKEEIYGKYSRKSSGSLR